MKKLFILMLCSSFATVAHAAESVDLGVVNAVAGVTQEIFKKIKGTSGKTLVETTFAYAQPVGFVDSGAQNTTVLVDHKLYQRVPIDIFSYWYSQAAFTSLEQLCLTNFAAGGYQIDSLHLLLSINGAGSNKAVLTCKSLSPSTLGGRVLIDNYSQSLLAGGGFPFILGVYR